MHPLIGNLTDLTDDDLQKKLSELSSKLNAAHRFGSHDLVQQLYMIIENYQYELKLRNDKHIAELQKKSGQFKSIIDIQ